MKEKRPLVWLSAVYPGCAAQETILQGWQLIPVTIKTIPRAADLPGFNARIGVLDLSALDSNQLGLVSSWMDALPVEQWITVLEAGQVRDPKVCELINRYCKDYHTLPIQIDRFRGTLGHLWGMSELQEKASPSMPLNYQDFALEGESPAIRETRGLLRKFALTEEPVLIYGESGTGKEAAARFIHDNSSRKSKPLVVINCAALPASLTQNELFGHEKGSFTHAMSTRKGRIETADGGTLMLAGIDELKPDQQSAILRFLQEGQVERIGGRQPIKVNARLIVTSTTPLEQLVASGSFRSDVFYRLGGLHVLLPPLRERKEDIPLLIDRILSTMPSAQGPIRLADTATLCLAEHSWPGNLRELQNRLRQALLLAGGPLLEPADIGLAPTSANTQYPGRELSLNAFRSRADRQAVSVSLALAHNNVSAAARLLNISRISFYRLMDKHQIPHGTHASSSKGD